MIFVYINDFAHMTHDIILNKMCFDIQIVLYIYIYSRDSQRNKDIKNQQKIRREGEDRIKEI